MSITVNLATEHLRTATTSPQTGSHAAASSGVKGVIVALVHGTSSTDHVSAVSYGGTALTTSDTPVALVRNANDTTGIIAGTVIEE